MFSLLFAFLSILTQAAPVVLLTPENYDAVVSKGKVLVKYFSPHCGHCRAVQPTYEQVGNEFNTKHSDKVTIAEVDCVANGGLCGGIRGYPTFHFYKSGKTDFDEYNGDRSMNSFSEFLSSRIGVFYKAPIAKTRILTPEDFDSVVYDPKLNVLVAFTAAWCGHCKNLKPQLETAAQAFKDTDNVVLANIDADSFRDFTNKYGIHGYPTIKFFPAAKPNEVVLQESQKTGLYKGNQPVVSFDGGRSANDIIRYMNAHSGTFRTVGGGIEETAGVEQAVVQPLKDLVVQLASPVPDTNAIATLKTTVYAGVEKIQNQFVAAQYARYLNRITDAKGLEFAKAEQERLAAILVTKNLSDRLEFELTVRRNILGLFL